MPAYFPHLYIICPEHRLHYRTKQNLKMKNRVEYFHLVENHQKINHQKIKIKGIRKYLLPLQLLNNNNNKKHHRNQITSQNKNQVHQVIFVHMNTLKMMIIQVQHVEHIHQAVSVMMKIQMLNINVIQIAAN